MKSLLKIIASVIFVVAMIIGFNVITAETTNASHPGHAYHDDGAMCPNEGNTCAVVCSPSPCEHEK